jgi:hypothetical protein
VIRHYFYKQPPVLLKHIRGGRCAVKQAGRRANVQFSISINPVESPCSVAALVVNSKPNIRARPSFRVCVGLIIFKLRYISAAQNYVFGNETKNNKPVPIGIYYVTFFSFRADF